MTLASGARQLVVHEALETMSMLASYSRWFTPITNIGASGDGCDTTTFLAPPSKCARACSLAGKRPVHSST